MSVCATVSAMPPRTWGSRQQACFFGVWADREETYGVGDHRCEEWSGGIVGVELAHKKRYHGKLNQEDDGVQQGLAR